MDSHIEQVEELFSAAKTEFKHMEYFYFHNCLYEGVWKQNKRRFTDRTPTWDVLHKYPHDYKVVFVGDASMSPYEVMVPGGSVEHVNEEPGSAAYALLARHLVAVSEPLLTFPTRHPDKALDVVFASPDLVVRAGSPVALDEADVRAATDHRPVWVEVLA